MALKNYLKESFSNKTVDSFLNHLKKKEKTKFVLLSLLTIFYTISLINISTLIAKSFTPKQETKEILNPIAYESQVKGVSAEVTPTPTPTPTPQPTSSPPTPTPTLKPVKTLYKVAVFGDSMVDTMGQTLEYLENSLKKKYPDINFALYNYGQGSINVEQGLEKFNQQFSYSSRLFEPLPQLQADIIILGSFAYNPLTPHSRDAHWLGLTRLIEESEKTKSKVYLLAEIAPLRADFGRGPNGVNWSTQTRIEHSGKIIQQLENAVALSKILNVPLINVFERTYDREKKEGRREYINFSDGIHPSVAGHKLTADLIAETIRLR